MAPDPVSAAGLVLAIPGVIDLMIKYGVFIKDRVRLLRTISYLVLLIRLWYLEVHLLDFCRSISQYHSRTES
jgi:hypothetical protein